ncbi:RraA family protein [Bradyrhizobium sp. NBAIM20]|uniref:Putative 4-hydroxy-4-methyl-2-oxoglutarate aldolase n=1 Tax=Bradyrhizobium yuanmingense TaxID=108015 RepID=A0ABV4GMV5_9BRAD|nr:MULTISPECIES: RraA family protein [unclassified Bradyrhizobium]MCA1378703.1 RraA family protein [Bradyrhizobium sp. IC4060]MCA1411358.1 RraA family protein [Bradyrhizobium sp. NBAIM20]MCA1460781.1 RraA family protein [Bradyrhizobium sp. NBAIM18]MCA1486556.1 RraA family protein [Bradyrhizobium sp. IC4061]
MSDAGIAKNPSAPQVDPAVIAKLMTIPVALLSDQLHRNCGSIGLIPYHSPAPLAGTAVTVKTRGGDNLAILRAYDFCRPGDVMVVDAGGDISNALVGGIMTLGAASLGLAGMVLDGAIRDLAEIRQRTFPVYARGVTHRGPYKDGPGAINVPITVGGMPVNAGDIIVGDQDGLLAFPPSLAATVIEKALAQEQKEHGTIHAIREGRWDRAFVDALEARCAN